jgi:hypothetical protein
MRNQCRSRLSSLSSLSSHISTRELEVNLPLPPGTKIFVGINPSTSEVTVPRICNIDPARRICGNKLNSDRFCLDIAFIPEDVYVVPTRIDEPHPCFVHMRLAVGVVTFIIRQRSRRDDD